MRSAGNEELQTDGPVVSLELDRVIQPSPANTAQAQV